MGLVLMDWNEVLLFGYYGTSSMFIMIISNYCKIFFFIFSLIIPGSFVWPYFSKSQGTCLSPKYLKKKYKRKSRKENKKINLKLINYFYILFQAHLAL